MKILSLGTLVTVRQDPVRVAEEYATLDVISKGRLQIGFVKSGGTEMASGDANPVRLREREWEAIDLIEKALTSHDGPFSWEGQFFTHPHVNIWPRPWQQPRPDFWAATSDLPTCAELGRRGMVNTLLFGGYDKTKLAFDAYKRARAEAGLPPPGEDRFAYLGFCYVGETDEEALQGRPEDRLVRDGQHEGVAPVQQVPARADRARAGADSVARPAPGGRRPTCAPRAWWPRGRCSPATRIRSSARSRSFGVGWAAWAA